MDVNTRGGLFGPGGYGGGIFDGSQMGFGGLGQSEQAAAGIGLGATTGAFQWCSKTSPCATGDPRVKSLQTALNRVLSAHKMKPLVVDGKFGAATCGAMVWLAAVPVAEWQNDPVLSSAHDYMIDASGHAVCQSYTAPTRVGSSTPVDINKEIGIQLPSASAPWMQPNGNLPGLQQGVNHDLAEHGFDPISVTGMLDAETCGAMLYAKEHWGMSEYLQRYGQNCQAFTAPHQHAEAAPPPGPAPSHDEETPHAAVGTKKSGVSTAWVLGGLAAAAGVAGLVAMSKKRR
jgi:hypothetical protein